MNKDYLISMMKNCPQFNNQTVYEHCLSVQSIFIETFNNKNDLLPKWFLENFGFIKSKLIKYDSILEYTEFHDVGKPFCIQNINGTNHFPNHSELSYNIYSLVCNNEDILYCIKHDMDIHMIKDKDLFINKYSATLLFIGFCELFANAKYFGGFDSISYKIKYKQLDRRGKKIIQRLGDL